MRQTTDDAARGGRRRAYRVSAQRYLHPFLHVAQRDVTHFVADDRFNFIIIHQIHQPAVNADAAVSHGEGVNVFGLVYLIVHRLAVDVVPQRGGDFTQTFAVFTAGRRDSRLRIHLLTGFVA